MRNHSRYFCSLALAAALASPMVLTSCAARASYRVYDPDHEDYHRWDDHEVSFYVQWESETHQEHRDFDKRDRDDQKQYWNWRHSRDDKDHDQH